MNFKLLKALFSYERIPVYLRAIIYAVRRNILTFKVEFRGMLSLPEGVLLHQLASKLSENSVILEIGCYGGLSTAFLLAGAKKRAWVYSIDPFRKDLKKQQLIVGKGKDDVYKKTELLLLGAKLGRKEVGLVLRKKGFKNFTLVEGYSHNITKRWDKKIDLLWIDGNHEYGAVKRDFLDWYPFLKKGGIIVFHDANKKDRSPYWNMGWEGPTRVANAYLKEPQWINIKRVDSIVCAIKN